MKRNWSVMNFLLALVLLMSISSPAFAQSTLVPDTNLESAIRNSLWGVDPNAELTKADLQNLYDIWAPDSKIVGIKGLEYAINLSYLVLNHNKISDLSPLKNLKNLSYMDLSENQISNVSPLTGLTNVEGLNLSSNKIVDITSLKNLNKWYSLDLSHNQISNISALDNLKIDDGDINLSYNKISDISSLSSMSVTQDVYLDVSNNQIKSLDPLKNITKVTKLFADSNQLTNLSFMKNLKLVDTLSVSHNKLKTLDGLSVTKDVYYDINLSDNYLTNISQLSPVTDGMIDLTNNRLTDITPLKNMQAGSIFLTGNPLNAASLSVINTWKKRGVEVVYVPDKTPPALPTVNSVADSSTTVTGKTEAAAAVTATIGQSKYTSAADDAGNFKVTIPKQKAGTKIAVTAKDLAGNVSAAKTVTVVDKTAPVLSTIDSVSDQSTVVSGKTEARASVTAAIGTLKYSATADKAGSFKVTIPKQKAGTKISVTVKDAAGIISAAKIITVLDKTAPAAPKVKTVTSTTTVVTGTAEASATITIKVGTTTIKTGTVDKNGNFKVTIKAQKKNTVLSITAKDAAGNVSAPTTVKVQ